MKNDKKNFREDNNNWIDANNYYDGNKATFNDTKSCDNNLCLEKEKIKKNFETIEIMERKLTKILFPW